MSIYDKLTPSCNVEEKASVNATTSTRSLTVPSIDRVAQSNVIVMQESSGSETTRYGRENDLQDGTTSSRDVFVHDFRIGTTMRVISSQLGFNITCEMPEVTFSPPPAFAVRKSERSITGITREDTQ